MQKLKIDMNEELKPYLKDLLEGLKNASQGGLEFIETQAPELCKEIITFGQWYYSGLVLLGLLLLIASGISIIYCSKKCSLSANLTDIQFADRIMMWACTLASTIVGSTMFFTHFNWALKSLVAPRLFLIEYIAWLVK